MGDKTGIEWTDATWNPTVGCSIVSPGCTNCYAMKMAARVENMGGKGGARYAGLTQPSKAGPVWTGEVRLALGETLTLPLRWKRPRRIFVNSMSDLFHESLPDEAIDKVFAVMALAPQHTFQVLTKRAERMRRWSEINSTGAHVFHIAGTMGTPLSGRWPLPNVWLGVSVEDQARKSRIDNLRETPAARRFLSIEPLLDDLGEVDLTGIDWVIVGGESGPNARPMHPDWARSLRDQCAAAGVPFFFKQWGEWLPFGANADQGWWHNETKQNRRTGIAAGKFLGSFCNLDSEHHLVRHHGPAETRMVNPASIPCLRVGKRAAGRLLDGVEHNAFPGET